MPSCHCSVRVERTQDPAGSHHDAFFSAGAQQLAESGGPALVRRTTRSPGTSVPGSPAHLEGPAVRRAGPELVLRAPRHDRKLARGRRAERLTRAGVTPPCGVSMLADDGRRTGVAMLHPCAIEIHWLGHASVLVEDRARILTDPLLTGTMMHLHRRAGPLPRSLTNQVDAVVVSHLHLDHLHFPSLAMLDAGTPVLLPRGAGRLLRRTRLEAVEVTAGDVVTVGDATVTVVPAVHAATRWPLGRVRGDAIGFVVRGAGATYFAGDTSLFPEMETSPDASTWPCSPWVAGDPGCVATTWTPRMRRSASRCWTPEWPYRSTTDVLATWPRLAQEAPVPRAGARVRSTPGRRTGSRRTRAGARDLDDRGAA